MAHVFTLVVVGVTVGGILLSLTRFFHPLLVAGQVGRVGVFFDHDEDHAPEQLPDGNLNDPPIPFRPIRPRG